MIDSRGIADPNREGRDNSSLGDGGMILHAGRKAASGDQRKNCFR